MQVRSLQRALAEAQRDASSRQDAQALRELQQADKAIRGLGPGGDLCVFFLPDTHFPQRSALYKSGLYVCLLLLRVHSAAQCCALLSSG